ncbi:papilin b, proteoglycan-like sulfated glycoprotein isoform X2 [Dunckerocampus dactyliophorus]|uniref:papilin b, proteoglycan-like sulfated glycoprotein isoform X2 n=1 Tax=Dunckerocampus dactyliophorus TaxID=161453 RepID=UPI0024077554|nr:papilin b, proteoglycan-like sulfated glycoprotein isoform X2 [Dunckerocampus dactyliophorus]
MSVCSITPWTNTGTGRISWAFSFTVEGANKMDKLRVLALLQLLAIPAVFTQTQPLHDHWGEFGPFGPCSRSCGTGVAMRTRKCITLRTDGGHNCVGSSESFQICNTNECPVGSRDFREEQCSQFDRMEFQGRHHTWVPYYGANPCELTCVTREENIFYRHWPKVQDGTLCHVGRSDICVDGICRAVSQGVILGMEDDTYPDSPRETQTYVYKTGAYGDCSATCDGGMQYRSVECWLQDPVNPHAVDETYCIMQRLLRPQCQQVCNMHPCDAKYTVSSFSECSVTCGEGQQTREVICEGLGGEHLADEACIGLTRPPSVRTCRRRVCHTHIAWHVAAYGLCTRSCGGGVRERQVGCFDSDLKPHPVVRCGITSKPVTAEQCNTQPCHEAQRVPSLQDPGAHESTMTGFVPHVPGEPSIASRPNTDSDASLRVAPPDCQQSAYGCCPDSRAPATGPRNEGCSQADCVHTRYGCCLDGVTAAQGFGRAGCPEYQTIVSAEPTPPPVHNVCSLPRDEGPCDTWKRRFYYNPSSRKCTEFWFGGCQGNSNNFFSLAACQRKCEGREPPPGPFGRTATS